MPQGGLWPSKRFVRIVRLDADMTAAIARICDYKADGQQACLPAGRGRCSLRALARRLSPAAFRKLRSFFRLSVLAVRQ